MTSEDELPATPEPQTVSVAGIPSAAEFGPVRVIRHIPYAWLVGGFEQALERLRQAIIQGDEEVAFRSLFETLHWAVSALDYLQKRKVKVTDPHLKGLVLPRNRVHHQWADALERRELEPPQIVKALAENQSRIAAPGAIVDWYWRDANDLPSGDSDRGLVEYRDHLAGEQVASTLVSLTSTLRDYLGRV